MSSLLDLLLSGENKATLDKLSTEFGLDDQQTRSAVEELIPALSRGLQKNTANEPGMNDLLEALRTGDHKRYMEQPDTLGAESTTRDGNDILGHIFGSKEVSREVAKRASTSTGLSSTLLKKMLPVLATVVMGSIGKSVLAGGRSNASSSSGAGGIIGSLLDSDRDGSVWDDVLGMAARSMLR